MNSKMHSRGQPATLGLAALTGGASASEAAQRYTPTIAAAEVAALQAAMRPVETLRKQLEAFDPMRGIRAVVEQYKLADGHLDAIRAAESSALEQIRRSAEMSGATARVAAVESAILAKTKAIQEQVRRLEEMSGAAARSAAVESAILARTKALREQVRRFDETSGAAARVAAVESAIFARAKAVQEQVRRSAEMSSAAARFAHIDSVSLARTKAIQEMLSPSKMAAKYLEELTGSRALKLAAEQAMRWSDPYKELAGALERFKEPLGISSARALVESMAKASEPFGAKRLLEDAAQLPESEGAPEEIVHLVRGVTEDVSKASTLEEAVDQIVQAIEATKEPLLQKWLFAVLVPFLLAIVFAFVNPVGDFYVKRWLETTSKQEATKQVKEAACAAVGDVRLLDDFRFVSAQSLALKSGPKAKAAVVGQLRFGQAVRVLEKERDFTLVVWRSEDGKVELQGWVFSRYLRRFG